MPYHAARKNDRQRDDDNMFNRHGVSAAAVALGVALSGRAAAEPGLELAPMVVTATRVPESSADLPASIDVVGREEISAGQLEVNLSESLMTVPGVSAQSRQNYAQDLQLSVRGFGARSSFGVRGVRLYSDGIPGTMPDGQGQFSQFDLGSAERIEVLRGPFSALYGNSSGGVISIFTQDGPPGDWLGGTVDYGSFNTQRAAVEAEGAKGSANYVVDLAHFQTDGYRDHSAAQRTNLNGKLRLTLTEAATVTVVANAVETPFEQDPLGLTRAQLAADPRQAGVNALSYNTRKSLDQEQLGLIFDDKLSDSDDFTTTLYDGHRATKQFQAIPKTTQASPLSPGGVIGLNRAFWGVDAHLADQRTLGGGPIKFVAGLSYDDLDEARRGYLNFIGPALGVQGALRRDEANYVYDFDQYLQAEWDPALRWKLIAGVRNSTVDVTSYNHRADGVDPQSGVRYSATDPVAGVTFRAAQAVNAYASYGKGFETPTLNDLAYRSTDGSVPGLNLGLKPARSDNAEVGLKAGSGSVRADLALFGINTHDELAVLANSNGRTVNQNIGETTRRGAELGVDADFTHGFSGRLAYTYLRAVVASAYYTCVAAPCVPPATAGGRLPATDLLVPVGNHLPAVPENSVYAGLTWRYQPWGFSATLEEQGRARIYTDDRNSNAAASYWVADLRAGFEQQTAHWRFTEFARVDNVADRTYVGSVIVNDSNSRFFEAAPGRTYDIMFSAAPRTR
jgi:iron complex outermembrane receptor protein